jgi:hypothetical protein
MHALAVRGMPVTREKMEKEMLTLRSWSVSRRCELSAAS